MCGFYITNKAYTQNEIEEKCKYLHYRGPDQYSYTKIDDISIFHCRLIITGDQQIGKQPLKRDNHVFVFNGEIYNYKELAKEFNLSANAYLSDSNCFFELFLKKGNKSLELLDGFYAFSIYDTINKNLTYGRDNVGKKPLFYTIENGKFEVSSSLLSIGTTKKINLQNLFNSLLNGFNEGEDTVLNNIFQAEPGYVYCQKSLPAANLNKSFANKSKQLTTNVQELERCVKKRLPNNQNKIGLLLSGGVDSSFIASVCQKLGHIKKIKLVFVNTNLSSSERINAQLIADSCNLPLQKINVDKKTFKKSLDLFSKKSDRPILDPSIFLSYLAYDHLGRCGVKIALNGDGADEKLHSYKFTLFFSCCRILPNRYKSKIKEIVFQNYLFTLRELSDLFPGAKIKPKHTALNKYFKTRFRELFLAKTDCAGSMSGIEVRAPFCDGNLKDKNIFKSIFKRRKSRKNQLIQEIKSNLTNKYSPFKKVGFSPPSFAYLKNLKESGCYEREITHTIFESFQNKGITMNKTSPIFTNIKKNHNKIIKLYIIAKWLEKI